MQPQNHCDWCNILCVWVCQVTSMNKQMSWSVEVKEEWKLIMRVNKILSFYNVLSLPSNKSHQNSTSIFLRRSGIILWSHIWVCCGFLIGSYENRPTPCWLLQLSLPVLRKAEGLYLPVRCEGVKHGVCKWSHCECEAESSVHMQYYLQIYVVSRPPGFLDLPGLYVPEVLYPYGSYDFPSLPFKVT